MIDVRVSGGNVKVCICGYEISVLVAVACGSVDVIKSVLAGCMDVRVRTSVLAGRLVVNVSVSAGWMLVSVM